MKTAWAAITHMLIYYCPKFLFSNDKTDRGQMFHHYTQSLESEKEGKWTSNFYTFQAQGWRLEEPGARQLCC